MNPTAAIFIVSDKARAMKCQYVGEADSKREQEVRGYTFKTLDQSLKKGDIVVIPTGTRHGFTCVKIVENDVPIDTNGTIEYKWIVGKVDLEHYEKVLDMESNIMEKVRIATVAKQRRELRADLGELAGDLDVGNDLLMIEGKTDPVPVTPVPGSPTPEAPKS